MKRASSAPTTAPAESPREGDREGHRPESTSHDDIYSPRDPLHLKIAVENADSSATLTVKWINTDLTDILAVQNVTLSHGTAELDYAGPRPLPEAEYRVDLIYNGKVRQRTYFEVVDVDAVTFDGEK